MKKAIMKIMSAYVSRNETCFIKEFEFITKVGSTVSTNQCSDKYKVGTIEIDKMEHQFNGSYYITLGNHGVIIEEIM